MKQKLLLTAVLTAIILSASANLTVGLLNKVINPHLVSTIKIQGIGKKSQGNFLQFNQLSTPAKVRAAGPISTFPYVENFDSTSIASDGWLITDASTTADANMTSGTLTGLTPLSGSSYLISGYDTPSPRNAWAFSPSVSLTAGVAYHVYVWAYAPGYNGVNDEFKVTVGTDQTSTTQTTVLIDKTGTNSESITDWTRFEGTYTPTTSGNFNFAISHCTAEVDVNYVAFENFAVSENVYIEAPIAQTYYNGGLYSASAVLGDSVYLCGKQSINYVSSLINADTFSWSFDADATASSTTDVIPSVSYATSGLHTATLTAIGQGGTTVKNISTNIIKPVALTTTDVVYNFKSYDAIENYVISTNNYVAGPNADYKKIAEKYELPSDATVSISQIYMYVGKYILSTANRAKAFTIQILKADGAGGLPGTVVSSVTPTFSTVLGTATISTSTLKTYTYTTPVSVTGSFYISLDFTNAGTPSASNSIGLLTTSMRSYADCTMYAYYNSVWTPESDTNLYGELSAFIAPKITFQTITSVENPTATGLNAFVSGNNLHIQNATAGQNLTVYDLTGHILISEVLKTANDVISISLKKGMYLVKAGEKTAKVMVN